MSEANGRILASDSTGRILCHPTSGVPLYGATRAPLSVCVPDLLRNYTFSVNSWSAAGTVHYIAGGIGTAISWYGSSGGETKLTLWWAYHYNSYKWFAQATRTSTGSTVYGWTKALNPTQQCPGPEGVYNGIYSFITIS